MSLYPTDLTPDAIAGALSLKPFQGKQVFQWIHKKQVFDFESMTNLSKSLRDQLHDECTASRLTPIQVQDAPGSDAKKVLFALPDDETVEAVILRDGERRTICVSTQVGCPIGCTFCATGQSGFHRNLSPGEIVEQVLYLIRDEGMEAERTPNIVVMGMGEPFLNTEATFAAIDLLMHPDGMGIGARKITVSTSGVIEGIQRFADRDWQVRLSISLHAANNGLRNKLVPLNRKYPLEMLQDALIHYIRETGRQITIEWTLIKGVNDSEKDAEELAQWLWPLKASVNLIPMNPVDGIPFAPPSPSTQRNFESLLNKQGIPCTLRKERGGQLDAACGQLRRRKKCS